MDITEVLQALDMANCTEGMTAEQAERTASLAQDVLWAVEGFIDEPDNDENEICDRVFSEYLPEADDLGIVGEDAPYDGVYYRMIYAAIEYWDDELFHDDDDDTEEDW